MAISGVSGVTGGGLGAEEQAAITRGMATTTAVSKLDALTFIKNSFSPFSRMMLTVRLLLTKVDPMVIIW
jgi:hypothetical protein